MKTIIENPIDRLKIKYKEYRKLDPNKENILIVLGYSKAYRQLRGTLDSQHRGTLEHHEDFTDCILPFIRNDYNVIIYSGSSIVYDGYRSDRYIKVSDAILYADLVGNSLILKDELIKHRDEIFKKVEDFIKPLNIETVIDFSCRSTFVFNESYKDFDMLGSERFKGGVRIKRDHHNAISFLNKWNNHMPSFSFGGYISLSSNICRAIMHTCKMIGADLHIFSPDPRYSKLYKENIYTFAADDMYYPITEDFKVDVIKHGYVTQKHLKSGLFNNPLLKFKDKKMDLLFCGTVSSERNESRIKMYEDYIMNIADGPHSLYYKKIKGNELKAPSTYEHILNNKFHKGIEVTYDECTKQFIRHKYSFVPSPIINNSYHRRIAQAVSLNNLPLVAHDYDPLNKQLPSKFNDILRVKNSSEINQKIKYFNQNPEEAQEIIDEIKQYMGFNDLNNKDSIKKYILKKLKL